MKATAIVPVKRFRAAKQRLVEVVGPPGRAALAKAMLADVLAAATRAQTVDRVIVLTGEGRAEKVALAAGRDSPTPLEVLRDPDDRGHSHAATLGIVRARSLGAQAVALLPGDCPLLDPGELDDALGRLEPDTVVVVPDRHGNGTNGLFMCPGDAIGPAFGPDSRERHIRRAELLGMRPVVDEVPSLALDLDTAEDLAALTQALEANPGRAPATAEAIASLEIAR